MNFIGNDRTCDHSCFWKMHPWFVAESRRSAPASNQLPSKSGFIFHHSHNFFFVHIFIPCFATDGCTNHPGCSLRARNDRLWRRQRDYGSSTRKTIQIINTSRGDGRAWSRVRVNWTRELRRTLTPRIKCTKWKRIWEGCTINRSMVVSYERAIVLQFGLCHTFYYTLQNKASIKGVFPAMPLKNHSGFLKEPP